MVKLSRPISLTSIMNPALKFVAAAISIALTWSAYAADPRAAEPCSLMSKEEAAAVLGELKSEPASQDGLRGKKCSYDNLKGAWVTLEVYSSDAHWDLMKNMALDAQALTGLGEDAFSAKRGGTRQIFVKKGASMIEVDSSAGLDVAKQVAAIAVKRLP